MNLTFLQERRFQQVKDEIALLEYQTRKRDIWFAIWFSFVLVIVSYLAGYFFDWLVDGILLMVFIKNLSWLSILVSWFFGFLVVYLLIVNSIQQQLNIKKKELAELKLRYGLAEEAAP